MRTSVKHIDLRGIWKLLVPIGAFIVAMVVIQGLYVRRHAPVMLAESKAADVEGEDVFKTLGLPPNSKPSAFGEKHYWFAGRTQWKGAFKSITLSREFEMPGDYPKSVNWYREHMMAAGWSDYDIGPSSSVKKEFRKDKWVVTLWNDAQFPEYTRVRIELRWRYNLRAD